MVLKEQFLTNQIIVANAARQKDVPEPLTRHPTMMQQKCALKPSKIARIYVQRVYKVRVSVELSTRVLVLQMHQFAMLLRIYV